VIAVLTIGCGRDVLQQPRGDSGEWTSSANLHDAAGAADAKGTTDGKAVTDAKGSSDTKAAADANATSDAKAASDAKPTADAKAMTDAKVASDAKLAADAKAIADSGRDQVDSRTPLNWPCSANDDCASGFCTDGVCCDAACVGPCVSCALAGSSGFCSPIPAGGTDLHGSCVDQGAAGCGHDGFCDGSRACRFYQAGVPCAASGCSGNVWTSASTCNGAGSCLASLSLACSPFACDAQTNSCHTFCTGPDDCQPGFICSNGLCGKGPLGDNP